eukprot:4312436-Amphidinium_carterae.1
MMNILCHFSSAGKASSGGVLSKLPVFDVLDCITGSPVLNSYQTLFGGTQEPTLLQTFEMPPLGSICLTIVTSGQDFARRCLTLIGVH